MGMTSMAAAAALLGATAAVAQTAEPAAPVAAAAPAPATAPKKVDYKRVCTVQPLTGGLIRSQKTCSKVPVAIAPAAHDALETTAAVPQAASH